MTLYAAVPNEHISAVTFALENLRHLGSHDSLCSLQGEVERCQKPESVIYSTPDQFSAQLSSGLIKLEGMRMTRATLSRFKSGLVWQDRRINWFLAGGNETEQASYIIRGGMTGTTRGKIYRRQ